MNYVSSLPKVPLHPQHAASRLQLWCEQLLISDLNMKKTAAGAFLSFLQAYASEHDETCVLLCYKDLQQGHYAKR